MLIFGENLQVLFMMAFKLRQTMIVWNFFETAHVKGTISDTRKLSTPLYITWKKSFYF